MSSSTFNVTTNILHTNPHRTDIWIKYYHHTDLYNSTQIIIGPGFRYNLHHFMYLSCRRVYNVECEHDVRRDANYFGG